MSTSSKRIIKICFALAIVFLTLSAVFRIPKSPAAFAEEYYEAEINDFNGKYSYKLGSDTGTCDSLQEIFDTLDVSRFAFNSVHSTQPVTINSSCTISGEIVFELSSPDYAVTVGSGAGDPCTVNLRGFNVFSNSGCIFVDWNGRIKYDSGTAITEAPLAACSIVNVFGEAEFIDCQISKNGTSKNFCYGINCDSNGKVTVKDNVRVSGDSAICANNGTVSIEGGKFSSPVNPYSIAGYAMNIYNANVSLSGGTFLSPVKLWGETGKLSVECDVNLILLQLTPQSYVTVFDKRIYLCDFCVLTADISGKEIQLSGETTDGYRIKGYTVDGNVIQGSDISLNIDEFQSLTAIESNLYEIDFTYKNEKYCETKSYAYDSSVDINTFSIPVGYSLNGFSENGTPIGETFKITGDTTLEADISLMAPTIAVEDEEFVYTGQAKTITPQITHPLSSDAAYELDISWEILDEGEWKPLESKTLSVKNVSDSASYRVAAAISYKGDSAAAKKEININIKKKTYSDITYTYPEDENRIYDPAKRLEDYPLPDGYEWVLPKTVPDAGKNAYPAKFNDNPNYEEFSLDIIIGIKKSDNVPSFIAPYFSGTYNGGTLDDYGFFAESSAFSWKHPDEVPVVYNRAYSACYNPDRKNYNDTDCLIYVDLAKGKYPAEKELPEMNLTYSGETLYELQLPAGYRLDYSLEYLYYTVLTVDKYELKCIYNEESDTTKQNYEDLYFTLEINVEPSVQPMPGYEHTLFGGKYCGKPLSYYEYLLPQYYSWENPDYKPDVSTERYSVLYNTDEKNHIACKTTIVLQLEKGVLENFPMPSLASVTYNPQNTLADIPLDGGWSWTNPDTVPTVSVDKYPAEYDSGDINYETASCDVSLTVLRAPVPKAVLNDKTVTYDGEMHYLDIGELPYPLVFLGYKYNGHTDAATYTVIAYIGQSDTENYTVHPPEITGTITIKKAPSVIVGKKRFDVVFGSPVPSVDAVVQNSEQTLLIPAFTETDPGIYTLVLTTSESRNYLAGEFTVTIAINNTYKFIGNMSYESGFDGSTLYGMAESPDGIPSDCTITFTLNESEAHAYALSIESSIDGTPYDGKFVAKILMSENLLKLKDLKLVDADNAEIDFRIENGIYLVFETEANATYYINAKQDKPFPWWWILVGIAVALAITVTIVVLYKKGIIKVGKKSDLPIEETTEKEKESESENGNK